MGVRVGVLVGVGVRVGVVVGDGVTVGVGVCVGAGVAVGTSGSISNVAVNAIALAGTTRVCVGAALFDQATKR